MSSRDGDNAHLIDAALAIHGDEPAFGHRFIADEIEAESGVRASERRVWRLCSQLRIWSHLSRNCGLNRKAGTPVLDDFVQRDVTAQRANQLWVTGITEHRTTDGIQADGDTLYVRDQRPVVEPDHRLPD